MHQDKETSENAAKDKYGKPVADFRRQHKSTFFFGEHGNQSNDQLSDRPSDDRRLR